MAKGSAWIIAVNNIYLWTSWIKTKRQNHKIFWIKAHLKTIYEGRIVCIRDEIIIENPFRLRKYQAGEENPIKVGSIFK